MDSTSALLKKKNLCWPHWGLNQWTQSTRAVWWHLQPPTRALLAAAMAPPVSLTTEVQYSINEMHLLQQKAWIQIYTINVDIPVLVPGYRSNESVFCDQEQKQQRHTLTATKDGSPNSTIRIPVWPNRTCFNHSSTSQLYQVWVPSPQYYCEALTKSPVTFCDT